MFDYCPEHLDAAPAHRCLCTLRNRHLTAHECLCGHRWGDTWCDLTYDQQRALLGLPDVKGREVRAYLRRIYDSTRKAGRSIVFSSQAGRTITSED